MSAEVTPDARPGPSAAHVVHFGKFYPPRAGGIEQVTGAYAEAVAAMGTRVSVLCFGDRDAEEAPSTNLAIHRCKPLLSLASGHVAARYIRLARRLGQAADVVHVHEPNPLAAACALLLPRRVRVVVSWHADVVGRHWARPALAPLQRRLASRAAAILVLAPAIAERSRTLAPFAAKCRTIACGLPLRDDPVRPAEIAAARARFGGRFALAVGRLAPYKGFDILVRALERTGVRLVLVGDGALRDELAALVRACGLAGRVILAGHLAAEDLRILYAACAFFVLPSTTEAEAFGLVQIEAMHAGKAVVNTALASGVPHVSRHGETGLTVPPGCVDALRAALVRLWTDEALCAELGAAGRIRARTIAAPDAMARSLFEAYGLTMPEPL